MKAIQVKQPGGPEVMQIQEVPDLKPGPGQVVVQVHAAGVNPVDTYIRSGNYSLKLSLPFTPGFDGAGTIRSIGEGVAGFQVGERVYLSGSLTGTYAEQALCKVSQIHPLPKHVSFSQGAGINVPYASAYRALFQRANAKAGEIALIHGASGGVGIAATQLARAAGLRVIGTASTERGRSLVQEMGVHFAADHSKPDYIREILAFTRNKGVNVIIEMLANKNLNNDMTMLARNGRVVVVGNRGTIEIDPRLIMGKDGNILGMSLLTVSEDDIAAIHSALGAGLENHTLNPVVGQEFPLAKASEAHIAVMQSGAYGKIVLVVSDQ